MDLKRGVWEWNKGDHLPLDAGKGREREGRGGRAVGGLQRPSDNYIQPINDRQAASWARGAGALGEHVRLTLTQTEISSHVEGKEDGWGGGDVPYVLFANM